MSEPMTFVQKALARAAGLPAVQAGQIVDVQPDRALSHDNTAAIARIFAQLPHSRVWDAERLVVVLDHAVPAPNAQHAANHAAIRAFVAEQGIRHFFDAGRGICHQVLSEEALILPGQLLVGADSHTPHAGWLGAMAVGIGRSEMAAVWATGSLWLRVPESIRIELVGRLREGVSAKDVGLFLLAKLGPAGATYRALEFGGSGLATLDPAQRMVIANLMAEAGAKNAYLTPDEQVFAWLAPRLAARRGRSTADWLADLRAMAILPDAGAEYAGHFTVDLGQIEPLVACPHSPAHVRPLAAVAGTPVQQAFIGTCTNGRLQDLAAAAAALRDDKGAVRRVAPGTRLIVIPASHEVLQAALEAGYIATFVEAGAMIGTPGCGPCMGNHCGVPAAGEVVISTGNRNFRGRMGEAESEIYLAGPAAVAAAAVAGRIVAPQAESGEVSRTKTWEVSQTPQLSNASQVSQTSQVSNALQVYTGRVWKYGDNVNTDVIFPGKYTYSLPQPTMWPAHALEDLDPRFAGQVQEGDVIVAGENWGCGSSREQAVTALKLAGVRAIIARSFARIYYRNCLNQGLLPIISPAAVAALQDGDPIAIDMEHNLILTPHGNYPFPPLSTSLRAIVDAGGLIPMLQQAT